MEDSSSCKRLLPSAFSGLKPLGERVRAVTPDEFRQRIEAGAAAYGRSAARAQRFSLSGG